MVVLIGAVTGMVVAFAALTFLTRAAFKDFF